MQMNGVVQRVANVFLSMSLNGEKNDTLKFCQTENQSEWIKARTKANLLKLNWFETD